MKIDGPQVAWFSSDERLFNIVMSISASTRP
jgi:hypothetical protein